MKLGATGCSAEGRIALRDASPRKAQGKQLLLEPAVDCAESARGAIKSLRRTGLMLSQILQSLFHQPLVPSQGPQGPPAHSIM